MEAAMQLSGNELKCLEILLAVMMEDGAKEMFRTNDADAPATLLKLRAMSGYVTPGAEEIN
jgi:hypothetical protein